MNFICNQIHVLVEWMRNATLNHGKKRWVTTWISESLLLSQAQVREEMTRKVSGIDVPIVVYDNQ